MDRGNWFILAASLFALVLFAPGASAGICSSNGYPVGADCNFVLNPAQFYGYTAANCPVGQTISYNCNTLPSKYQSGCIGADYYDYGYTTASVQVIRGAGNTCGTTGDFCQAVISRNDARCGYAAPPSQTPPTYTSPSFTPPTTTYPVDTYTPAYRPFGYCGDFTCQYGEDLFNCPIDCGLFVPWPPYYPPIYYPPVYYPPTYYPPAPTPPVVSTPVPPTPTCAISASPSKLTVNGTSAITVTYQNFQGTPQGNVVCGDGQVVPASCSGTGSGSCTATCDYSTPAHVPAQFIVSGTLDGRTCANGGVTIQASSAPGRLVVDVVNQSFAPIDQAAVLVNGKTQFTNMSGQTEFRLSAGNYLVRASKAKHGSAVANADVPAGGLTHVTLQLQEQFSTLCQVSTSPSTVRGGQASSVTVRYTDAQTQPQNIPITCGNGQIVQATCTGDAAQGTCTGTCAYPAEPPYPRTQNIEAAVSGQACNPASVTVVRPLSSQGNALVRVSACTTGELLSGVQMRINAPSFQLPANFTGDGVHDMATGQSARADNGYIVRLDSISQQPAAAADTISVSTGEQNFSVSATDTATIGQSYVRLTSSLSNSFNFGSLRTNTVYYVTDATTAGNATQGLLFYQSPTTGFFVPYLHANAEGRVTYAAGTRISGSALSGASIVNATPLSGCSDYTTPTNLGGFSNLQLTQTATFDGGTPRVDGYTLSGFTGTATVLAQSVNASCTSGNYTLSFNNAAGALTPGLGAADYDLTFNYAEYDYGVPVLMQFYAPGITVGANDPNTGNGYTIAIPEYLTPANVSQGAFMLDVGFGDQSTPRLLSASGPAQIGYTQPYTAKNTTATAQPSGFLSPRGSTGAVSLNAATIRYALELSAPAAAVSFLNPQGQVTSSASLAIGQTASTTQVYTQALGIAGNTSQLEIRSLTPATPNASTLFYTDAFGQVHGELSPGTYSAEFFKDGYNLTHSTFTIQQSQTTTHAVCLEPRACDFGVELVFAPTCNLNSDQYQLRISNSQNQTKNVTLTYSSTEMSGPGIVVLPPNQATIINVAARSASPALSGQSLGIVNVAGPDACTQSFSLPLCIEQKVVVQAPQDRVSTAPGNAVCTTLLVKNRALENVRVVLSGQSNVASLFYDFSPQSFMLSSLQIKNIQLCATPQSGSSGAATLNVFADSAFGQSNATVSVETFGQGFFATDFAGCPLLDADRNTQYALNVHNTGEDGDYLLVLEGNELSVRNEYVLQQFQKDATRAVSLQLEPQGTTAGRHLIDYFLKKDGRTVFQDQLCFDVRGTSVAEARVQPNPLDVPKGQTRAALMLVHNLGSLKARYFVSADGAPLSVRLEPSSFILEPNQENIVNVVVSAPDAIAAKAYTVPLKVSAQTALTSIQEQYSVDVQCGDGQQKTVTCPAGTGSCTATCTYGSTGFYTPSANVGGRACNTAAGTVQVLATTDKKCVLQASPNNVNQGAAVTVTASFNNLDTALNGTLDIQCGNGQVAQAVNCNGNTGSCSTVCNYPDSGAFTLTATQGANVCEPARVAVGNPSQTVCQISTAPNTMRTGESATITLRYYNLPVTGTSSSTLNVPVFVDSDNLLVNVLDTSDIVTLSSAQLTLGAIEPHQIFPGTTLTLQLRVRNDNYFAIDNIAVYAQNVPQGFAVTSPPRFTLRPGQERLVPLNIQATPGTATGTYSLDIVAESPGTLAAKQKALITVLPSTAAQLNVDVAAQIAFKKDGNVSRFILDLDLTNREPVALTLTPTVEMQQPWPSAFSPATVSVAPDGTGQTQGQVVPTVIEPGRDYPGTLRIRASDGRFKDVPIVLNDQGSILGGLIVFGEGTLTLIGLAIVLFLLAVAAFFVAGSDYFKAGTEA